MYLGPLLVGHLAAGVLAGKLAADIVFYALAIVGYQLGTAAAARRGDPFAPDALDAAAVSHAVPARWTSAGCRRPTGRLSDALLVDAVHFAMKCNPDGPPPSSPCSRRALVRLASYTELTTG